MTVIAKGHVEMLTKENQELKEIVKNQSQSIVDLAGLFMPVSGLAMAMIGCSAINNAKKYGYDIKPSGQFFDHYISYEEKIKYPFKVEVEKVNEKIRGIDDQIEKMKNTGNCIHGTNGYVCSLLSLNNPKCEGCIEWQLK